MDYALNFLERVHTRANIGTIQNNCLTIDEIGLQLTVNNIEVTADAGVVNFQMTYPALNEIICDVIASAGESEEEVVDSAAYQFLNLCLLPLFKGLSREDKSILKQELFGQKVDFIECPSELLQIGADTANPVQFDLYSLIQDDLMNFIGFKQIYYIKLFAAKNQGKIQYVVRIDEEIIPELSEKLKNYAEALSAQSSFIYRIQTVTLWAKNGNKAPFNFPSIRALCHDYLIKEFLKLPATNSQEQYESIYDNLLEKLDNIYLAQDIYALLPEIACEVFFEGKFKFNQTIAIINGRNNININASQLALYRYLKIAISQYLDEHELTEQDALNLFGRSSRWSALNADLERNEAIEEIKSSMIALIVAEDYVIY